MRRHAATSRLRFLAAALPALLACVLVAPSSARASCGDYVSVNNRSSTAPHGEHAPAPQPSAKPEHVIPCSQHAPGDPAPPCQGPGCSGNPLPAPAPVSTAMTGGSQDHRDCLLTF